MTDDDWWLMHAYWYGFRRAILHDFDRRYPGDPEGKWFNQDLAVQAERMWGGKQRKPIVPATSQEAIRTNWREIPVGELTEAERAIAIPSIKRMMEQAKSNIASVDVNVGKPPAQRRSVAQEIPPPAPRSREAAE